MSRGRPFGALSADGPETAVVAGAKVLFAVGGELSNEEARAALDDPAGEAVRDDAVRDLGRAHRALAALLCAQQVHHAPLSPREKCKAGQGTQGEGVGQGTLGEGVGQGSQGEGVGEGLRARTWVGARAYARAAMGVAEDRRTLLPPYTRMHRLFDVPQHRLSLLLSSVPSPLSLTLSVSSASLSISRPSPPPRSSPPLRAPALLSALQPFSPRSSSSSSSLAALTLALLRCCCRRRRRVA